MKMVIIRHGQTDANLNNVVQGCGVNYSLNSIGIMQAEILGFNLKEYKFEEIYTSKLIRARETAEILAKFSNAKVIPWTGLEEVCFGDAENMSSEEARRVYKNIFDKIGDPNHPESLTAHIPNGESVQQSLDRGMKAINAIKIISSKPAVAVVTHGALMYNLYKSFFAIRKRFDNCEYFEIDL
jgi:broad specificity phosphatase PhoE